MKGSHVVVSLQACESALLSAEAPPPPPQLSLSLLWLPARVPGCFSTFLGPAHSSMLVRGGAVRQQGGSQPARGMGNFAASRR